MSQDQLENGRWKWVKDIIIPTLVATVALVGTFLGSLQANNSSRETQRNQFSEERAKVDRDRRADVYLKFLSVSREYAEKLSGHLEECGRADSPSEVPPTRCQLAAFEKTLEIKKNYYAAENEVYIFGSDGAAKIAEKMGADLPASSKYVPRGMPTSGPIYGMPDDPGYSFMEHYEQFQQLACREIPATPRAHC